MDASELLKRYAVGERDFPGIELMGAILSIADLCRANLRGADLSEANLSEANLSSSDLSEAFLGEANLRRANLSRSDLSKAFLGEANLRGANLSYSDLSEAFLGEADLSFADLSGANLSGANLSCSDLCSANLMGANLSSASLMGANLSSASLMGANLNSADLGIADLSIADLSGANLSGANLSGANLFKTLLTNTNLREAKLDGTILAYQKASEELQQKNQELIERVKLLEAQLEKQQTTQDLNQPNNQGVNAPYQWNGFYFRSKTEIRIAEALDRAGVLFYPNSKARLHKAEFRINRESDFLVFQSGKFGILEVDGRPYHQTAADDHERDRLFKRYGIRVIERFDATRCWNEPDKVVREFLEILSQT